MRFKAYGFDVQEINGQDMQAFLDALDSAKENNNGKPKLIIAHTLIGKGIPEVAGTYKAHGEAGAKFVDAARKALGLPDEHYYVSKETYEYFAGHKKELLAEYDRWEKTYNDWRKKNPEKAKLLEDGIERKVPADLSGEDSGLSEGLKTGDAQSRKRSAATDRAGLAFVDQRQCRPSRLDSELHQRWRRFHPQHAWRPQYSLSAFANTACARL